MSSLALSRVVRRSVRLHGAPMARMPAAPSGSRFLATAADYSMKSDISSLAGAMKSAGVSRGFITSDHDGKIKVSHPVLNPIAAFLQSDDVDYDKHEAIFLGVSPNTGELMSAFLWKTKRGQGCGGVRLREYHDVEEYIRDGLRLSIGMGRKSGLAGLWWGGGKGIIPASSTTPHPKRKVLLEDYGEFVTSLRGAYVAAEDVGITVADVDIVFSKTRFTTCISPSLGGSGNPSVPTALGVKVSMEGALHALHGMQQVASPSLEGKVVAVQGLGNVGFALVGYLLEAGVKRVIGADISEKRVADALAQYDDTGKVYFRVESRDTPVQDSILSEECDILSPCGFGGILNANTVPHIKAKIVCGAANNQLLDSREDYGMSERGITYVPDFVCNRMGIVNCANEQYGSVGEMGSSKDPMIARHLDHQWEHSVFTITDSVIHNAHKHGTSTDAAARIMADQYAQQEHPVMGHRTADIIRSLEEDGWAK